MNTQPADQRSFFEAEDKAPSTWKVKAGRMYGSLFRSRKRSHDAIPPTPPTTANDASPGPSSSSSSAPSSSLQPLIDTNPSDTSSRTPRRRRYINVWIRAPAKGSSSSPSSSSSSSRRGLREEYRNAFKDRVVRKHITICAVSALLLLSLIPLYSVFANSYSSLNGQTYHIFFLLLIMVFAIILCHSLARTLLLATHIVRHGGNSATGGMRRIPSVAGPLGYAQPAHPIHVVLARDEEIALDEREDVNHSFAGGNSNNNGDNANRTTSTPKLAAPPPAYGLWRNSVRINPNLLYWQRVEAANTTTTTAPKPDDDDDDGNQNEASSSNRQQSNTTTTASASTQNRPPSYASDDGVEYVVEAQPRSTVSHYRPNS